MKIDKRSLKREAEKYLTEQISRLASADVPAEKIRLHLVSIVAPTARRLGIPYPPGLDPDISKLKRRAGLVRH